MKRRARRRGALRKRFGCFVGHAAGECEPGSSSTACPPKMKEAKSVKGTTKNVGWMARTDPKAKTVEFAGAFDKLTPEGKRYITLHERAHLKTGTDHNAAFYAEVMRLAKSNKIDPWVAFELEQWNCHQKH